ncbi:hypothetical protein TWF506_006807 [Arthrobotrys conoides]|uniref:Uncharacterized protein n=1 Tax=Arthrobotrys conoides TaxID=74498 RepID=A0AAN8NCN6_9PEZI
MCHWRYFHNCKKTTNKWVKLVPGPFEDCMCGNEVDSIEVESCVASCALAEGYQPSVPHEDKISSEPRKQLRTAVREYKDGKIRATDLIKAFLKRLGK